MHNIDEKTAHKYLKFLFAMLAFEVVMTIISFINQEPVAIKLSLLSLCVVTIAYTAISTKKKELLKGAGYFSVLSASIVLYEIFLVDPLLINLFFLIVLMPISNFFSSHKLNFMTFMLISVMFITSFFNYFESFEVVFDKEDAFYFFAIFITFYLSMTFHLSNQKKYEKDIVDRNKETEKMNSSLQDTLHELEENREKIENFSVNLDLSMKETSKSVTAVSLNLSEMKQTFDFQSENIQDIYNNTHDNLTVIEELDTSSNRILENANTAKSVLSQNNTQIESIKNLMNHLTDDFQFTTKSTLSLQQSAEEVRETLNVINSISSKVKLLSLNASIEAARSGEAGRGFKVVADEIKVLATNTEESSKKIEETINNMMSKASSLSERILNSSDKIKENNESINHLSNSFSDLTYKNNSIFEEIKLISDTTNSIRRTSQHITESLSDFSSTSEETNAALSNVVANFEEISATFNQLTISFESLYHSIKKES